MLPTAVDGSISPAPSKRTRVRSKESNQGLPERTRLLRALASIERLDAKLQDGKKRTKGQEKVLRAYRTRHMNFVLRFLRDFEDRKAGGAVSASDEAGSNVWLGAYDPADLSPDLTPGQRLKRLRQSAGFNSMRQLSRAMHVRKNTYYDHEAGRMPISKAYADTYANFFKLPPGVILYGNRVVIYPDALPNHRLEALGLLTDTGKIHPFARPDDPRREINFRVPILTKMEAVYIDTDVFAPTYCKGDYVFFEPPQRYDADRSIEHLVGRDCYMTMDHGRKTIGTLGPKVDGGHVIHLPNRTPLVRYVHTASLVRWIKRASDDG